MIGTAPSSHSARLPDTFGILKLLSDTTHVPLGTLRSGTFSRRPDSLVVDSALEFTQESLLSLVLSAKPASSALTMRCRIPVVLPSGAPSTSGTAVWFSIRHGPLGTQVEAGQLGLAALGVGAVEMSLGLFVPRTLR